MTGIPTTGENSAAASPFCGLLEGMKTIFGETSLLRILIKIKLRYQKGNNYAGEKSVNPKKAY